MIAVDTNVVVRLLTGDDKKQTASARALFRSELVWISGTVLLETGWVLKSLYGMDDTSVCAVLRGLLGLENVEVEDGTRFAKAFDWTIGGLAFADAMHLSNRPDGARFVTFDRDLVRKAKQCGVDGVSLVASS